MKKRFSTKDLVVSCVFLLFAVVSVTTGGAQDSVFPTSPTISGGVKEESGTLASGLLDTYPGDELSITISCELSSAKSTFRVGDEAILHVTLLLEGAVDDVDVDTPRLPQLNHVEVKQIGSSNRLQSSERAEIVFSIVLSLLEEGEATIDPIVVNYTRKSTGEPGTLSTEPLTMSILPLSGGVPAWVVLTVGMGILILAGSVVVVLTRRRPDPAFLVAGRTTPFERIRAETGTLHMMLVEGDIKGFYDKIITLTKGVVSISEGEEVLKLTYEELSDYLGGKEYDRAAREKVLSILKRCEQVRFGGCVPPREENERILRELQILLGDMEQRSRETDQTGPDKQRRY